MSLMEMSFNNNDNNNNYGYGSGQHWPGYGQPGAMVK